MRALPVEDPNKINTAMMVICPICFADINCACDQFTSPHPLPFTVHFERYEAAIDWASRGFPDAD